MLADSAAIDASPAADAAAVPSKRGGFGTKFMARLKPFLSADGRSRPARLLREVEAVLAEPFGGMDRCDFAVLSKIHTVALLTVRGEQLRDALARGEPIDDEVLIRNTNSLRRERAALDRLRPTTAPADTGKELLSLLERGLGLAGGEHG